MMPTAHGKVYDDQEDVTQRRYTFSGLIITETPGTALSSSSFTFAALHLNCWHCLLESSTKKQVVRA
jgi:hypothetical protein